MLYWTAVSPGSRTGPSAGGLALARGASRTRWPGPPPPGLEGDEAAMPTPGEGELGNSSILAMVSSAGQGCALGAEDARAAVTGVDGV